MSSDANSTPVPALAWRTHEAWLRPLILVLFLVIAWDLAVRLFKVPPYLVPKPWDVVLVFWTDGGMLLEQAVPTHLLAARTVTLLVRDAGHPIASAVQQGLTSEEVGFVCHFSNDSVFTCVICGISD